MWKRFTATSTVLQHYVHHIQDDIQKLTKFHKSSLMIKYLFLLLNSTILKAMQDLFWRRYTQYIHYWCYVSGSSENLNTLWMNHWKRWKILSRFETYETGAFTIGYWTSSMFERWMYIFSQKSKKTRWVGRSWIKFNITWFEIEWSKSETKLT